MAALGYLGGRFCVTPEAGALRERLLRWAPGRLDRIKLGSLRLSYLPDVYMTCSYAFGAGKHAIKADLIAQARRALLEAGCREPKTRRRVAPSHASSWWSSGCMAGTRSIGPTSAR